MSKKFLKTEKFKYISIFISVLVASFYYILKDINSVNLNKKLIIPINFLFIILITCYYVFIRKILKNLTSKSNFKIFKSDFFKEDIIDLLFFLTFILLLLITFEIFHYIYYGSFNISYIYDVLNRATYSGNFLNLKFENSNEINNIVHNILVVNAFYIKWLIYLIKFIIFFIFIDYIRRNLNKGPVV